MNKVNATLEWLQSRGYGDLADAVRANAKTPVEAFEQAVADFQRRGDTACAPTK